MKSKSMQKILSFAVSMFMLLAMLPAMVLAADVVDSDAALRNAIVSASAGDTLEIEVTGDVTLTDVITIPAGVSVSLYSSTGAVITAAAQKRHFNVSAGASLTLSDITP